jgi:hypothetical protein
MFVGYKCFNKGLVNRYGIPFEVGKTYHTSGEISFGNNGNGFHVCKNLEDTLRYFDAMDDEVDIALVNCYGKYALGEDDYNGYYDMYAFEYMTILKVLTREEIIKYALSLNEIQVKRFISMYHLTPEEIALFKQKFAQYQQVLNTISYYQEGDTEAFTKKQSNYVKTKKCDII